MKRRLISVLAIAGLAIAAAAPAHAGHDDLEVAVRVGSGWVYYSVDHRLYDRRYDHRHDHDYRHWLKHQKRHYRKHRHQPYAHDRWHWHYDRRRNRYYRCDHY